MRLRFARTAFSRASWRAEERFDEGVVVAHARAAEGGDDAAVLQRRGASRASWSRASRASDLADGPRLRATTMRHELLGAEDAANRRLRADASTFIGKPGNNLFRRQIDRTAHSPKTSPVCGLKAATSVRVPCRRYSNSRRPALPICRPPQGAVDSRGSSSR